MGELCCKLGSMPRVLADTSVEADERRAKAREYYRANRAKCSGQMLAATHRRRALLKEIVDEARRSPCVACGLCVHPVALIFHHRDPATKTGTIAKMVTRGVSEDVLRHEMAKCDLICANCHMIIHYADEDTL